MGPSFGWLNDFCVTFAIKWLCNFRSTGQACLQHVTIGWLTMIAFKLSVHHHLLLPS
jgi:hypothetical protein